MARLKGVVALILGFAASPINSKEPTAVEVIALAQEGASVFYQRSACTASTANIVRLDVSMFAAKYVPQSEVKTVMWEFDKELERMGYGNPYMKHQCDPSHLRLAEERYRSYKAELERNR